MGFFFFRGFFDEMRGCATLSHMGSTALGSLVPVTLVLLASLVAAIWVRRRLEQGLAGGHSVRLTGEHAVHVVTVEGRRWMIGTGPAGPPTLLAELPAEVPEAAGG